MIDVFLFTTTITTQKRMVEIMKTKNENVVDDQIHMIHFRDKLLIHVDDYDERERYNENRDAFERDAFERDKIEISITRLKRFAITMVVVNVLFASYVTHDIVMHNTQPVEHITQPVVEHDVHDNVTYRLLMNIERDNDDNTIDVLKSSVLVEIKNDVVVFNELN